MSMSHSQILSPRTLLFGALGVLVMLGCFGDSLWAFAAASASQGGSVPKDVAGVPSHDLRAGGNEHMRYFLVGIQRGAKTPKGGYKLVLILPGGDGSADFNIFVRRIWKNVLGPEYAVAQLVAPVWAKQQAKLRVWPTKKNPWPGMKFTTETFVGSVIADVRKRCKVNPARVLLLAWSSSGQAAYAYSLTKGRGVTGTFVAMSVFKPQQLPELKSAKGHAYYLLHSPQDFIPIKMAEDAKTALEAGGAKVKLQRYEGGHGWRGDIYGNLRAGFKWLEEQSAGVKPRRKGSKG